MSRGQEVEVLIQQAVVKSGSRSRSISDRQQRYENSGQKAKSEYELRLGYHKVRRQDKLGTEWPNAN